MDLGLDSKRGRKRVLFLFFFFNVDFYKVFIEFVTRLFLFYVLAFWPGGI